MIIVDGHNLAFADDDCRRLLLGGDPNGARKRLVDLVDAYVRTAGEDALVIFDGTGGSDAAGHPTPRVRYSFSGAERTADVEIMRIIRGSTGRRDLTLVTSDRTLTANARTLRAQTIGVGAFLKETARRQKAQQANKQAEPAAKRLGPSPREVEYWLKVFTDDDVDRAEREDPPPPRKKRGN